METGTGVRRLVIHDLEKNPIQPDADVACSNGSMEPCVGCYSCWVATPGKCALRDGWEHMGWRIANCDELVIVSRCVYGGVSAFVKNVLDRSIPYLHPDFEMVAGRMHHKQRYEQKRKLRVFFYGKISAGEQTTAKRWVDAMAINMNLSVECVSFSEEAPKEVCL